MGLDATTSITIGGVTCWDEACSADYGRDGSQGNRTIRCVWTDYPKLVNYLLGGVTVVGSVVIFNTSVKFPDAGQLYLRDIHVEGAFGQGQGANVGPNGMVGYPYALLTLTYKPLDYSSDTQTTSSIAVDYGAELITIPQSCLKWSGGGAPAGGPAGGFALPIPIVRITQVRTNLPFIPNATILAATAAPLNSLPIFGAGEKMVMFDGGRSFRRNILVGTFWDLEYTFKYRPIAWDKLMAPDGNFYTVQSASGNDLIASSDLNQLFI